VQSYQLIAGNDDFIVVNKLPNVSFHSENGIGLIHQLSLDYQQQIYPVHRLDKATSGLLICAKNQQACSELSLLFQNHQVEKYYLALSAKKPLKKQGLIKGDMERSRNGSWKLTKSLQNPAITQFFSYSLGQGRRLFILKPNTGKTHQLRVALKSIGSPILGDIRYGPAITGKELDRMYLHAYQLRFTYKGENLRFSSLPEGNEITPTVIDYIQANLSQPSTLNWPKLPRQKLFRDTLNDTN
jgi:tRNA pseudouridine32 synthase/23S rRNA pseudouridine746 synthase